LLSGSVALLQHQRRCCCGVTVAVTITISNATAWELPSTSPPVSPLADARFVLLAYCCYFVVFVDLVSVAFAVTNAVAFAVAVAVAIAVAITVLIAVAVRPDCDCDGP